MTLTQIILQLTAHPLLLRLVLVATVVAFSLALYAIAERLARSRQLFDNETAPEEPRRVLAVAYFW